MFWLKIPSFDGTIPVGNRGILVTIKKKKKHFSWHYSTGKTATDHYKTPTFGGSKVAGNTAMTHSITTAFVAPPPIIAESDILESIN